MSAIERRRTDYRAPDDHNRLADDALLELWTICEQVTDAPDADLPAMRNRFLDAIDTYRAERHRGGHIRHSNGRGGLVRDPDEPPMPERLAAAAGLAVMARHYTHSE